MQTVVLFCQLSWPRVDAVLRVSKICLLPPWLPGVGVPGAHCLMRHPSGALGLVGPPRPSVTHVNVWVSVQSLFREGLLGGSTAQACFLGCSDASKAVMLPGL